MEGNDILLYDVLAYIFAGRVDPVPFEQKDDHMGLGRWALEVGTAYYYYSVVWILSKIQNLVVGGGGGGGGIVDNTVIGDTQ